MEKEFIMFDKDYFKNYKEQKFKWIFWSDYIKKRTTKEDNILEIGCTYGFLFKYIKSNNLYGIDISEHAINQAKIISPHAHFQVMDAEKLNFKNKFKIIIAIDVLEHLKNPENCIKECYKLLENNGTLIIVTPNPESYSHKIKKQDWFAYKDKTHISIHNKEYWTNLLKTNNFRIKTVKTMDLFDFPYANKLFRLLNLISYKLNNPFYKKIGDNIIIISKKN